MYLCVYCCVTMSLAQDKGGVTCHLWNTFFATKLFLSSKSYQYNNVKCVSLARGCMALLHDLAPRLAGGGPGRDRWKNGGSLLRIPLTVTLFLCRSTTSDSTGLRQWLISGQSGSATTTLWGWVDA